VLDNLAVFEPEDVHHSHAAIAWLPDKVAVNYNQVAFRNQSLEIIVQFWKSFR
jgi:hypothetical protein